MWSHFVPSHDEWFDQFTREWGEQVGVNVTVDHIDVAGVPARIAAELSAGQGHDLMQYIAPLAQFEPSVLDLADVTEEANNRYGEQLEICRKSSFNPTTGKFYAFGPGWVPDPGNFRRSMWEPVGLTDGPRTWDELLEGGSEIMATQGVQLGIGMSQEIDSNMAGRALMWSFGASIQDENENVVLNSPETVAAVEYMVRLFQGAMTDEVFSWNAASNNQGMVAGKLSYILNSISAYRTSQETNPDIANDTLFVPALEGPETALAAQHVMYNWLVPQHATNPDAAKEFLLHYTANLESAAYHSKLYDFPAWDGLVPNLKAWLEDDPFGSQPADKLAFLADSTDWATNIGHPGPANTAEGEVFGLPIIPNMFARAARGEVTPDQAVADATAEVDAIFAKWRARGLIGGGG
ncbi:extracellular solute-binding protein [Jiangella aurantiaca]|uniref:Extracellular solute-binding protein n=2 Tax=Jiangella aurantiaca TaxID=2530373 RepID=A0A4R5A9I6_9ACTN|nr:extracellular solute-binding protein [Jiangella aurantiaca]